MAPADEFDGFLVDLDGVVWVGRELVPGAVEALRALIDGGKEIVFVTNNPARPPSTYVERLREAGCPWRTIGSSPRGSSPRELAAERGRHRWRAPS